MSKSSKNKNRKRRETRAFSNQGLPFSTSNYVTRPTNHLNDLLRSYEDRRSNYPELFRAPNRPVNTFSGPNSTLTRGPSQNRAKSPTALWSQKLRFEEPEQVVTCVRRKQRREVLFAKNKTGKSGQRRPRWTELSKISCKR